jgi:NAD(P)-dependent dehydrogenase (short-subunit alcohol dehydrogenase family)
VGIGRGIAERFAAEGAFVIGADCQATVLDAPADRWRAVNCDVSREADLARLAGEAGDLDILVNCAGVTTKVPIDQMVYELSRDGIRVNAVAPGLVNTPILQRHPPEWFAERSARVPMGRMGSVDEIARAVTFLASDFSSYITGQAAAYALT